MKLFNKMRVVVTTVCLCMFVLQMTSCKKELRKPQEQNDNGILTEFNYSSDAKIFVKKMKRFRNDIEKCKTERVDYNMEVDSALWNVEALFNATYATPDKKCVETVNQDIKMYVDVLDNGSISMNEIASLFDNVTSSVRDAFANDGVVDNKALLAVVVDKGDIVGNKMEVKIHVVSGSSSGKIIEGGGYEGPFRPGDCWYFGEYGGSCDEPWLLCDAAEVLEDSLNALYSGTPVPTKGFRYINHNLVRVYLDGSEFYDPNGEPYIFNSTLASAPTLYFDYTMLNHYFEGERKVILELAPIALMQTSSLPVVPAFIEVDIRGLMENSSVYHHNIITYGSRLMIPEDELGPVRNLLN